MPTKDLTGRRFGRLVVNDRDHLGKYGWHWHCVCDCGTATSVVGRDMSRGHRLSCGCLSRDNHRTKSITHGHTIGPLRSKTYRCWHNMLSRCYNPRVPAFKNYGGRGITVCERWLKFETFLADLGECPPGLTIERENNDLGYFPGNCRYVTRLEQARNKRRQGLEKLTAADVRAIRTDPRVQRIIGAAYGVSPTTISAIKRGKRYRNI